MVDEAIPVMSEYLDVFANEFVGLPIKRALEFSIDLISSMTHISKALT